VGGVATAEAPPIAALDPALDPLPVDDGAAPVMRLAVAPMRKPPLHSLHRQPKHPLPLRPVPVPRRPVRPRGGLASAPVELGDPGPARLRNARVPWRVETGGGDVPDPHPFGSGLDDGVMRCDVVLGRVETGLADDDAGKE